MLSYFLREVLNWRYSEFLDNQTSPDYSSSQRAIFGLVQAILKGKLAAIREAIDRIDGKVEQPLDIQYPKFYTVYPLAVALDDTLTNPDVLPAIIEAHIPIDIELAGIRDTIKEMGDLPPSIVEMLLRRESEIPAELLLGAVQQPDPMIKSLVAAHMFRLIETGSYKAITELLDQIEGKVKETIRLLGDDVFITSYDMVAPAGAVKNLNGFWQIENKKVSNLWADNLAKTLKK